MSRSYKKNPIVKSHDNIRTKRDAAKAVRRASGDVYPTKGSAYKRAINSWEINDYVSRFTREEAIEHYYARQDDEWFKKRYPTLEIYLNKIWYKYYKRK